MAMRAFGGLTNPIVAMAQTCVGELVRNKEHQGTDASLRLISILGVDAELIQKTLCSKSFLSGTIPEGSWVKILPQPIALKLLIMFEQKYNRPRYWRIIRRTCRTISPHVSSRIALVTIPVSSTELKGSDNIRNHFCCRVVATGRDESSILATT